MDVQFFSSDTSEQGGIEKDISFHGEFQASRRV